jgi:hypothetical protein
MAPAGAARKTKMPQESVCTLNLAKSFANFGWQK